MYIYIYIIQASGGPKEETSTAAVEAPVEAAMDDQGPAGEPTAAAAVEAAAEVAEEDGAAGGAGSRAQVVSININYERWKGNSGNFCYLSRTLVNV